LLLLLKNNAKKITIAARGGSRGAAATRRRKKAIKSRPNFVGIHSKTVKRQEHTFLPMSTSLQQSGI
jgi:hypothetical protein